MARLKKKTDVAKRSGELHEGTVQKKNWRELKGGLGKTSQEDKASSLKAVHHGHKKTEGAEQVNGSRHVQDYPDCCQDQSVPVKIRS